MPVHLKAQHHQHLRKRIYQKHQPYPHPELVKRLFDKIVFIAACLGPIAIVPQIYEIWINNCIEGVSLFSWFGFSLLSSVWLTYGLIHNEKPIIVSSVLNFSFQIAIVIGILIHQ